VSANCSIFIWSISTEERIKQPADCTDPYFDQSVIVTEYKTSNTWHKNTPDGGTHMKFLGAFINPPGQAGDPQMVYSVDTSVHCTGNFNLTRRISAKLAFDGLSGFACFTTSDLKRLRKSVSY
jgi:hypothetical protein